MCRPPGAGPVEGGGDVAGQERAAAGCVIPGQSGLVESILPGVPHHPDRCDGLRRVDSQVTASVELSTAVGPEQRVAPARRVAICVVERLTERPAAGLQVSTDRDQVAQRPGQPVGTGHLEPGLTPVHEAAHEVVRHGQVLLAHVRRRLRAPIEVAGLPPDASGNVTQVDNRVLIDVRPVVLKLKQVRARAALNRCRDARW